MKYCKLYLIASFIIGSLFPTSCAPISAPDVPNNAQGQAHSWKQVQIWKGSFFNTSIQRHDDVLWELQITGNRVEGVHKSLQGKLDGNGGRITGNISGNVFTATAVHNSIHTYFEGIINGNKVSGKYRTERGQNGLFELTHQGDRTMNSLEAGFRRFDSVTGKVNNFFQSFGGR